MSNENGKLSFNKRISLVKKEVFEALKETKELDDIKGSAKHGYYSLSTIEKYLFPSLDKNDLDLDLEIFPEKIVGHWYDCVSDATRNIEIDLHRIKDVERLQLMVNIVQSEGAVKSYTRRYALTAILRLPSTDLIENGIKNNSKNTTKPLNEKVNDALGKTTPPQTTTNKNVVNQAQLKRYYAILKSKQFTEIEIKWLDECIKLAFNIDSKNNWNFSDYNSFCDYCNKIETTKLLIIQLLDVKIRKQGKTPPDLENFQKAG